MTPEQQLIKTLTAALREIASLRPHTTVGFIAESALAAAETRKRKQQALEGARARFAEKAKEIVARRQAERPLDRQLQRYLWSLQMNEHDLIRLLVDALRAMVLSCAEHKCGLRCAEEALAAADAWSKEHVVREGGYENPRRFYSLQEPSGYVNLDVRRFDPADIRTPYEGYKVVQVEARVITDHAPKMSRDYNGHNILCPGGGTNLACICGAADSAPRTDIKEFFEPAHEHVDCPDCSELPRDSAPKFWDSVQTISDEQRKLSKELRDLSGVVKQEFHAENLPKPAQPAPRYDETYYEFLARLDAVAASAPKFEPEFERPSTVKHAADCNYIVPCVKGGRPCSCGAAKAGVK